MSHPPTEYFGPHARRWTDPDTGETLSLNPRDYDRMVLQEKASALEPEYHDVEGDMSERTLAEAIVYGATRGGIKYPTPEESVAAAQAAAETARAAAHSAEESRDKALEDAGLVMAPGGGLIPRPKNIDWDLVDPDLAKACDDVAALRASYAGDEQGQMLVARILERKAARDANLSNDGSVSPSMPAAPVQPRKRPAARHWRHRRPQRIARWFAKFGRHPRLWVASGLVYILAVIGASAVIIEAF